MGSWFNAMFSASCTATGWGQDEARRCAHDAGFDHHMVKPMDLFSSYWRCWRAWRLRRRRSKAASSPLSGSGTSLAVALK